MSPLTCAKMLLFSIILFISPSRHTKNPVFSRAEQCWHSFHTYFNCIKPVFECQKLRKFWFLVQGPFRAAVTVECDTRWLCVLSVASEWRRRYSLISVLIFLRLERYGLKLRYLWQLLKEISWYSELFVRHVSFERFDLGSHRNNGFFFPSLSPFFFFFFCPGVSESLSSKTWELRHQNPSVSHSLYLSNSVPDPSELSHCLHRQLPSKVWFTKNAG